MKLDGLTREELIIIIESLIELLHDENINHQDVTKKLEL